MLLSLSEHMVITIMLRFTSKFILLMRAQVKLIGRGVSSLIGLSVKPAFQVQCYDQVLG